MHMMLEHGVYVFVPTLTMYIGNTHVFIDCLVILRNGKLKAQKKQFIIQVGKI